MTRYYARNEFDFQIYGDSKRHTLEHRKIILRYIVRIRDCGIMYASKEKKDLIGYIERDFAGSFDDRRELTVICSILV